MTPSLLLAAALSGAAYTLAPGPAFLALLGIGARSGRWAAALFLAGHFAGDILWATLSLAAILGAAAIGRTPFDLLGLACGAYLGALGWRAVRAPGAEAEADADRARPLRRGLAFGLSNPKAYPVSVAMFGALLSGYGDALDWGDFPALLAAACAGFVSADIALVACVGAGPMRRLYARHATLATRAAGVLFLGFAAQALYASVAGLLGR